MRLLTDEEIGTILEYAEDDVYELYPSPEGGTIHSVCPSLALVTAQDAKTAAVMQGELDDLKERIDQDNELLTAVAMERGELRTERDAALAQVARLVEAVKEAIGHIESNRSHYVIKPLRAAVAADDTLNYTETP